MGLQKKKIVGSLVHLQWDVPQSQLIVKQLHGLNGLVVQNLVELDGLRETVKFWLKLVQMEDPVLKSLIEKENVVQCLARLIQNIGIREVGGTLDKIRYPSEGRERIRRTMGFYNSSRFTIMYIVFSLNTIMNQIAKEEFFNSCKTNQY